ncbi:protein TolR [Castellaniella caeni]|uniref:protein TolR n=1 Tax=Castellaniella caeni TaxID=266123 RepID=UPI00082D9BC4|nr:protein TolR [Castellaniella caeni]
MTSLGGRRNRRMKNDINVVPYIDVMLVLLVIFMVTAPMITPGQIELPSVGTASDVPTQPIEVQIDAEGALSLRVREGGASFHPVDKASLLAEVRSAATPDTPVVISADGKVPYNSVMQVMDQLRAGGIAKLGLLVNQDGSGSRQ